MKNVPSDEAAELTQDVSLEPSDGRRARGERTRQVVLATAVQLASVEGLEGLSIGRLAERLGTAKSSVHATFGSKESLQLAVIAAARDVLIQLVIEPSLRAPTGVPQLEALGEAWMGYLEVDTFEGGCILSGASAEMDGRPGLAKDAITKAMREWLDLLANNVRSAIAEGELPRATDADLLAFELNAVGMATNWRYQLFDDKNAFILGRAAWLHLLSKSG